MATARKILIPDETRGYRPSEPGGKKPPPKPKWLSEQAKAPRPSSSPAQNGTPPPGDK